MKELAKKSYVDNKNICIWSAEINGYFNPNDVFISESLKNCKSVLVTLLKKSNYNITFELTRDAQLVYIDQKEIYFSLNRNNGTLKLADGCVISSDFVYVEIYIRN